MRDPVMEAEYKADIRLLNELKGKVALEYLAKQLSEKEQEAYISMINSMIESTRYSLTALSAGSYSLSVRSVIPMDPQSKKFKNLKPIHRQCLLTEIEKAKLEEIINKLTSCRRLSARECEALRLVIGEGFSQSQAGGFMGIHKSTICRAIKKAKQKLGVEL